MITLRELNPIAADQWFYPLNGEMSPDNIAGKSGKTAYFQCSNNPAHIWNVKIYQRTRGGNNIDCPFCAGREAFPGETDFLTKCPEAKFFWDYANNIVDPITLLPTSTKRGHFKCVRGHRFTREIQNFYKSPRCSECYLLDNNLAVKYPELVPWWDIELNAEDSPDKHYSTDNTRVFWKCPKCGYSWKSEIASRTASKLQCPACDLGIAFKQGVNDLATKNPILAAEWHEEKNGDLRPQEVFINYKRPVWWHCQECNYEWKTGIAARSIKDDDGSLTKRSCPRCLGKIAYENVNDFASTHPEYAKEFVIELNEIPLSSLKAGSNKQVYWRCSKCNQIFLSSPLSRTDKNRGDGCPYCAGKFPIVGVNDFATLYPHLLNEWAYDLNSKDPSEYTSKSELEVYWRCSENNLHIWKATIRERSNGYKRCPICNKVRKGYSLKDKRPDLLRYWDFQSNEFGPECYTVFSNKEVYWHCDDGHEFKKAINKFSMNTFYCSYCLERILIKGTNDLESQYPDLLEEFDYDKNDLLPGEIRINYGVPVYWICREHGHSYLASPTDRINSSKGCSICANIHIKKGFNDLLSYYPKFMDIWDFERNDRKPDEILMEAKGSFNFKCSLGHTWREALPDVISHDYLCPYCDNRKPLSGFNTLMAAHPELMEEWDVNNEYNPDEILPRLKMRVRWRCKECEQTYTAGISDKFNGTTTCPYCEGIYPIPNKNSFGILYPELLNEFSDENILNPFEVFPTYYNSKSVWKCKECNMKWIASIRDRTTQEKSCPYCNEKQAIPGKTSFKAKHPDLMEEWKVIANYILVDPDNIMDDYNNDVWWECDVCKQSYQMTPKKRLLYQRRNQKSCPHCKGYRRRKRHFI